MMTAVIMYIYMYAQKLFMSIYLIYAYPLIITDYLGESWLWPYPPANFLWRDFSILTF